LKSMAGVLSPRIMFTFFKEFPLASLIYIVPFSYAIIRLSSGSKVPDHFLFFILSVWIPLLGIGCFRWAVPVRYISQVIPFFIISFIAGLYYLKATWMPFRKTGLTRNKFIVSVFLIIAIINPLELKRSISAGYERFSDQKGAAEYIKTLQLDPGDLILAEDVLQQTYYLGRVDYWLRSFDDAKKFVRNEDSVLVDIYTSTPLIGTGKDLENLLKSEIRNNIYIISSGSRGERNTRFLGNGILEVINKYQPIVIYKGRDKRTDILLFPNPKHTTVPKKDIVNPF